MRGLGGIMALNGIFSLCRGENSSHQWHSIVKQHSNDKTSNKKNEHGGGKSFSAA